MIYAYTGTPGSGKTLSVVKVIKKFKGQVLTNIPIKGLSNCLSIEHFTVDYLVSLAKELDAIGKEGSILLVIDECQTWFNSREWRQTGDWINFFTQHRKLGYKVILICQQIFMIDKQIRSIVEVERRFRRLSRLSWVGYLLYFLTFGEKYLSVDYYAQNNQRLGMNIHFNSRRLFKYYDSYAITGLGV